MNSDLSLDFLRVVEQAAIACAHTMGQGDRHGSDRVAVEAMRKTLDEIPIDGTQKKRGDSMPSRNGCSLMISPEYLRP